MFSTQVFVTAGRSLVGRFWRHALLTTILSVHAVQVQAILYEWNFERDGGIYTNDFIEQDIFKKAIDGEVDIYIEQSADFEISLSEITIEYLDGSIQVLSSTVSNSGVADSSACNDKTFTGCVDELESDKVRFQHLFFSLQGADPKLDEGDIQSAQLELTGSGLDFDDPDLRVRWDWSNLGVAHNFAPVPEPAALSIFALGLFGLALMSRARTSTAKHKRGWFKSGGVAVPACCRLATGRTAAG
jgi:hypothetical protein